MTLGVLLLSNQQVSETVGESPMVAEVILEDLEVFVKRSEAHAAGRTSEAADETIKNVNQDLDGDVWFFYATPKTYLLRI